MDQSAIKELQKAELGRIISQALSEQLTTTPLVAVPDSFSIKSLEQYMPNLANYRGAFSTPSLKDFRLYNTEFSQAGAKCFVNGDAMSAKTIFDLGDVVAPLHKEHTANIKLERTSAYKALLNNNDTVNDQKEMANFLEDWTDYISASSMTGESMTTAQAAKALRDMTIESAREINSNVQDYGETLSAMERIEAKNKDLLPNFITFTCRPYNDLKEYQFKLRLSVLTSFDKPKISCRIIQLEQLQEDMVQEFKSLIEDAIIETDIEVFIGNF